MCELVQVNKHTKLAGQKTFTEPLVGKRHFIALIHPIQWTIANPVGADRPAKRQKKSPYMSA